MLFRSKPASILLGGALVIFASGLAAQVAPPVQQRPDIYGGKAYKNPVIQRGLQFWRKEDADQNACAFCHSPDGIELAAYAFSDDNIKRRAMPHVGKEGGEAIVAMIHALRKEYGFKKLLDPKEARPLQPGGKILPGKTATDRDAEFLKQLQKKVPGFRKGGMTSLEEAKKAKDALLKLNPREMPVGIPFNRLSEDEFHGEEHATVAHWFADVPALPIFPWEVAFDLQDEYIVNPTPVNLAKLIEMGPHRLHELSTPSNQMGQLKFNALLYLQHETRMRAKKKPTLADGAPNALDPLGKKYLPNPFWDLAEFSIKYGKLDTEGFHFPERLINKKSGTYSIEEQLKQITVAWLWLGWLYDQKLERVAPEVAKTRLQTLEAQLTTNDYLVHSAYALSRATALGLDARTGADGLAFELRGRSRRQYREPSQELRARLNTEYELLMPAAAAGVRLSYWLLLEDLKNGRSKASDFASADMAVLKQALLEADPSGAKATEQLFGELDTTLRTFAKD